ncbi:hypothetical protein BCR34DRAFT_676114 [Clohesyomyces aquaticus]|uniref:DUF6594 domain-containing protein n=1 Tax=Clohesyomyces aquaticus TaxID=1231657 RepID=A0A1Y1YYD0_9PLEO|nr:hypothetical protein BCR34DRAFT_676114 [Clohesyomyces aquaticus]
MAETATASPQPITTTPGFDQPPNHPLDDLVAGYPKLAGRMGLRPETAVFRRFGALNARCILYLQNDLIELEMKLKEAEAADSCDERGGKKKYAFDYYWLKKSLDKGPDQNQVNLLLEIMGKLREYNHLLIQQATVLKLKEPDAYDMTDIQHFLSSREMGPRCLIGEDIGVWGSNTKPKDYSPELVCLRPREDVDYFSRWVGSAAIKSLFKCGCARFDPHLGAKGIQDRSLSQATFWVTSTIASLIPIVSIVVLACLHSLPARLATIAGFNLLTSVCLTVFTDARRTDVFAVTAA